MAYTPNDTWEDLPSNDTPITAARLNHMEAGIVEGAQDASTTQKGNVELATAGEMTAGTDTGRVPSVKVIADYIAAGATGIPATIVDAKGDLIVGTAADTVARKAPEFNKYVGWDADGDVVGYTAAQIRTAMGADADDTETLTNKTLDFDTDTTGNVAENIPQEAVAGLTSALDAIGASGLLYVAWNSSTETYPARSTSGTSDPDVPVLWIRGPGPAISGTGSTGACVGDLWLRAV